MVLSLLPPLLVFLFILLLWVIHFIFDRFFSVFFENCPCDFMLELEGDAQLSTKSKAEIAQWKQDLDKRNFDEQDWRMQLAYLLTYTPAKYVRTMIEVFVFSFNILITTVIEFFDCVQVGDNCYIRSYPAIVRGDSEWKSILYALFFFAFFLIVGFIF